MSSLIKRNLYEYKKQLSGIWIIPKTNKGHNSVNIKKKGGGGQKNIFSTEKYGSAKFLAEN